MAERLKIFNSNYEHIGEVLRDDVHSNGYWHEVFQCWVIEKIDQQWHIYLQLRSKKKKDYPGQYDITAAGHLIEDEVVEDGVREMQEELGIEVTFSQLIPLGVIAYSIDNDQIKDYEFANVFLYELTGGIQSFTIQREELDGIYCTKLEDFIRLARNEVQSIEVKGYTYVFELKVMQSKRISLKEMSALPATYLDELIQRLEQKLKE